jgi:hypothetical protein
MSVAKKHEIYSALLTGKPTKEIAEELDVSYSYVLTLNRDLQKAKLENKLHELMDVDRVVIEQSVAHLGDEVKGTLEKIDGLQKLNQELQATATRINTQLRSHIMSTDHISELAMCTEILCSLQQAFFGKSGVQINVQQNNNGAAKYNQFLSDAPGE